MANHTEKTAIVRSQIEDYNAKITGVQQAFNQGAPEAVEWLVLQTLNSSPYPKEFPRKHQVAFRPENRDVVVEIELPPQDVIPSTRGYRYIKARDAIESIPRR
jgi:restriction system protein